jgi:selenocysteine lyase/cysteine desulfurase
MINIIFNAATIFTIVTMSAEQMTISEQVRADFPILREQINGKPIVYLDNAETTQKPAAVINAISQFYNAGDHATQVLHRYLGIQPTARVSLYFYNTYAEIDVFIAALKNAINI